MFKLSRFITGLVILLILSGCIQNEPSEVKVVSPDEMETILNLEDVQLVDVRTSEEFAQESIPGSQNIDFESPTFEADIDKLDKTKPVLLYCNAGGQSAKCAKKLLDAGFIKIYDLEGGITKWKYKGGEVKHRS